MDSQEEVACFCRGTAESLERNAAKLNERALTAETPFSVTWLGGMAFGFSVAALSLRAAGEGMA